MDVDRNLIGHGTRWAKEPRFHAKAFCRIGFQGFNRRIIAEDIVAHRGGMHRGEHFRTGSCDRVGSKISINQKHGDKVLTAVLLHLWFPVNKSRIFMSV